MGGKTLAEQLEIDENEAVLFMDTFRNTYPGIKKFIKETIDSCMNKGYIETIFGRRRYLPRINETNTTKQSNLNVIKDLFVEILTFLLLI